MLILEREQNDQYYTNSGTAEHCVETTINIIKQDGYDGELYVKDPCAGTGEFGQYLKKFVDKKRISLSDIDSKIPKDFDKELKYNPNSQNMECIPKPEEDEDFKDNNNFYNKEFRTLLITNPPFNGTLISSLFTHNYDYISLILPAQYGLGNRTPNKYKLIYNEELPKNIFYIITDKNGQEKYSVLCYLQIFRNPHREGKLEEFQPNLNFGKLDLDNDKNYIIGIYPVSKGNPRHYKKEDFDLVKNILSGNVKTLHDKCICLRILSPVNDKEKKILINYLDNFFDILKNKYKTSMGGISKDILGIAMKSLPKNIKIEKKILSW